jgi:hypothetical protein
LEAKEWADVDTACGFQALGIISARIAASPALQIEEAIQENESVDFDQLSRLLPGIQRFEDLQLPKSQK